MSSLKAVRHQIALQQPSEVYVLAVAADQAALSGDREACIHLVSRIYCLLDSINSKQYDHT